MLTPEERLKRKHGIGGSDIGALFNCDPYKTIMDIYLDKTTELLTTRKSLPMEIGSYMEPFLIEKYKELRPDCILIPCEMYTDPYKRHRMANVDSLIGDPKLDPKRQQIRHPPGRTNAKRPKKHNSLGLQGLQISF